MDVQLHGGTQSARLVTGAHIYFITLWQSSDGLKEADWETDFFFFTLSWLLQSLKFLHPLLSPSGACCYRNLAGWFNCLYWDTDTFQLFPCWRGASQKVFLVIWDLDDAGRRHSQVSPLTELTGLFPSLRSCVLSPRKCQQHDSTVKHLQAFLEFL